MSYNGDRIIEILQNFVRGQFLGKCQNVRPKKKRDRRIIMRLVCIDVKQIG
jgi:hypothetical protein